MEPRYHPDDSTLLSYAAGSVIESFSLLIAAHLEMCALCREKLSHAESLGADLMDQLPQTQMSSTALDGIWKSIENNTSEVEANSTSCVPQDLPSILSSIFPGGLDDIRWRTLVPGIQQHILEHVDSGSGTIRLLQICNGINIPDHTHSGSELTLILQGSYTDKLGNFKKGDISDTDSSIQHRPVVDSEEPCICLIATDDKLIFTNAINRFIQPFVGI